MARLSIDLPDELRAVAQSRATETGHASLEAYVTSLIQDDAGPRFAAPAHLRFGTAGELEAKLLEGLASPASEMTSDDWDALRGAVKSQRQAP